jgi:hemerythrin
MVWKKEFSVGIHEIDEQHKTLSNCIISLENAIVGRERWSAVHIAFANLADFARIHFSVEEALMRILELKRLKARALTADVSTEMVAFIRGWLDSHVVESDKRFALHFLKRLAFAGNDNH